MEKRKTLTVPELYDLLQIGYLLYFMGIHKQISILIPKKRGKGWMKSPFGGHHANDYYFQFMNLNTQCGDCVDVDGYLSIGFGIQNYEEEYKESLETILNGLKKVFPHISVCKEISKEEFYSLLGI